jgi:hypothetical protein
MKQQENKLLKQFGCPFGCSQTPQPGVILPFILQDVN